MQHASALAVQKPFEEFKLAANGMRSYFVRGDAPGLEDRGFFGALY